MSIMVLILLFLCEKNPKKRFGFVGRGLQRGWSHLCEGCPEGKLPFGQRRPEHNWDAPAFSVGKNPKKPGGFVAGGFKGNRVPLTKGIQRGSSPLAGRIQRNLGFVAGVSKGGRGSLGTRSCLQGLVC